MKLLAKQPARPDGLPMLLVAVNLLLLSFFVMLNAMASKPTSQTEAQANAVLARVQEGYNVQGPQGKLADTTPAIAQPWLAENTQALQGVLRNRLQISAPLLATDANQLVVTLPLESLFAGERLIGAELIRAMALATPTATRRWVLQVGAGQPAIFLAQAAALAEVAAQEDTEVVVQTGVPQLQFILRPQTLTPASVGFAAEQILRNTPAVLEGQTRE